MAAVGATVARAIGRSLGRLAGWPLARPAPPVSTNRRASRAPGTVTGSVGLLLRAEGLAVGAVALYAYAQFGAGWGWFAALFLLPDLAFIAYLAGPRLGAIAYNATHSYAGAAALLALGLSASLPLAVAGALIWCAHIGIDRAFGFGLKYAEGFSYTHLGRLGRGDPW